MIGASLGTVVHVRDEAASQCRPAIVTETARPGGTLMIGLRVFRPTRFEPTGSADDQSYYVHGEFRQHVADRSPSGFRWLDSWHWPGECPD